MDELPLPWGADLAASARQAVDAGDPYAALAVYEAAIERGACDVTTRANFGVLLWRLFQFGKGGEVFAQVVDDPQADAATLRRVAHCFFEIGRFGDAARVMRVAVGRLSQPDAVTTNTLAWTLERDHQTNEARQWAEAALAIDPTYGPSVRLLAHLDRREGAMDHAARRLRDHLAKHSSETDWSLRYELASVCDRLGEYDAAWRSLCAAKSQLAPRAAKHMRESHFIRQRQWELVQSITPADLRRWRKCGEVLAPRRRITFLTGFPRSGTTLLEQMIASRPAAIDTDESGILPSQFIDPMIWRADDAMSAIIELRSFDAEQLSAGRDTFYQLTESYLGQTIGTRLLVEKNPLLTADLALALRLFPEALLLVALRDPRDVVLSYLFTMVPLNWSSAPAVGVVEACQFYADCMRHWLWWRTRLEWPWHELHYERMLDDPEGATRRVAEFLGIDWDESMLDERSRAERRAVRTPTYDDVTKPLYHRAVGRWRNYEQYLAPGLAVLEPFAKALGYEW